MLELQTKQSRESREFQCCQMYFLLVLFLNWNLNCFSSEWNENELRKEENNQHGDLEDVSSRQRRRKRPMEAQDVWLTILLFIAFYSEKKDEVESASDTHFNSLIHTLKAEAFEMISSIYFSFCRVHCQVCIQKFSLFW